jgi:hypothetical protein
VTAVRQDVGTAANKPFVAGDRRTLRFTATEEDGVTPLNLTSLTIRWGLYAWPAGPKSGVPEEVATLSKSTGSGIVVADPAGGVIEVQLSSEDTASLVPSGQQYAYFWYELETIDSSGGPNTIASGHFKVTFQRVV